MSRARAGLSAAAWRALAEEAEAMRARAYAPYSGYTVGAALLARDPALPRTDQLFTGANVENASFGLCVCAERNAVAAAVLAGARELVALAVATPGPAPGAPCGMCRQVLAEFARDLPIALVVGGAIAKRATLAELIPLAFGGAYLEREGQGAGRKRAAREVARRPRTRGRAGE